MAFLRRTDYPANRPPRESGDNIFLSLVGILSLFGLVALLSASSAKSYIKYGDSYYIIKHQLFFLVLGIAFFIIAAKVSYGVWKKNARWMLFFSIFLLVLVFIPGLRGDWGTARSWISIFGFSLQPSEFVKISFLLYLAAWLEKRKGDLRDMQKGTLPFIFILGIIAGLMLLQPDFGTLSIIGAGSLIVYFVAGGKIRHIIAIVLIGAVCLFAMLQVKEYQRNRFKCLIDPGFDTQKICYQTNQALIAVGSGGIFGRGLGASRQKFFYLPEPTGDSIFAIIAEEMGFASGLILVILYSLIFYRGYKISVNAPDDYGKILGLGLTSWITMQAFINIGGIINLFPMTGVPLPFVSQGGSAIISALGAAGIIYNISKYSKVR
ncbi:MAG: putative lipid II flippase FtsW [Patescibacteria group bacterium]|jgi:cell division protein FtsW